MTNISQSFSIEIEVQPFRPLEAVKIDGKRHFSIAEIADLSGSVKISLFDWSMESDTPILNLIEMSEFLYQLTFPTENPVALTVDMEPVLYGWHEGSHILVTNFKSRNAKFNGRQNILGELTGVEFAMALRDTVRQIDKLLFFDPFLYAYVLGRMYRPGTDQKT